MNVILIVFLALLLIVFLCAMLYLIFVSPVVSANKITNLNCPDFWKSTNNLNNSSVQGCYIPSNTHASYDNIGECKKYTNESGKDFFDYCHGANEHVSTSNYASPASDKYVGVNITDITGASDCAKYNWTKLNNIKWNGISNNYNLKYGCSSK
mgnify:FL=1